MFNSGFLDAVSLCISLFGAVVVLSIFGVIGHLLGFDGSGFFSWAGYVIGISIFFLYCAGSISFYVQGIFE